MNKIKKLITSNKVTIITFIIGCSLGYAHWFYFGCYWGFYPMSAEWWVNCAYGGIFANLFIAFWKDACP